MLRASRRLRSAVFRVTVSMLFLLLAVGCGGGNGGQEQEKQDQASEETTTQEANQATTAQETTSQEETNEQSAKGVTEYVRTIQGVDPQEDSKPGDYFVALAIDQVGNTDAYMCDGTGNAQLFSGIVEQDRLDLQSVSGEATLSGSVTDSTVEGEIELGGDRLPFSTTRAEGIGGLYTFTKGEGYLITGTSERGNEVSAEYVPDEQALQGTAALANGEERPFRGNLRPSVPEMEQGYPSQAEFRDYRVIMLDSGRGKGNKTRNSPTTSGGSSGYVPSNIFD